MRNRPFALGVAALAALAGCSQYTGRASCGALLYYPFVSLLYPLPNATGVADRVGVLVYDSAPNGAGAGTRVPIWLRAPNASRIATVATGVPSPLPSPAATPFAAAYAVALPALSAGTTYQVFATEHVGGCAPPGETTDVDIGTFTTQ